MIIDEKGKLFGKINVIDLLVILFFVALIPMFYYGYKIFNRPMPVITSIEPDEGLNSSNIRVLIKGDNFNDKTQVKVGSVLLEINNIQKNEITAFVPKGFQKGAYDVVVTNPGNLLTILSKGFTVKTLPEISSVTPAQGQNSEDVYIKIKGSNFDKDCLIKIGVTQLAIKAVDDSMIEAVVPKGISSGVYALTVENPDNLIAELKDGYTVTVPPPPERHLVSGETTVFCKFEDILPETVSLISIGDKADDEKSRCSVTIVDIVRKWTEPILMNDGDGDNNKTSNIVICKVDIIGMLEDDAFYFGDVRISNNAIIVFKTEKYQIEGKIIPSPVELRKTMVQCVFSGIDSRIAELVSVNDTEEDDYGRKIAEILDINENDNLKHNVNIGEGSVQSLVIKEIGRKDITAILDLWCEIKNIENDHEGAYYKGVQVVPDSHIVFKDGRYSLNGKIISMPTPTHVVVRFNNIIPEIAKIIQNGDVSIDSGKDEFVVLKNVRKIEDDKVLAFLQNKEKYEIQERPDYKLVEVVFEVPVVKNEGNNFYKNQKIKVGQPFRFETEKYEISGTIIEVKDK